MEKDMSCISKSCKGIERQEATIRAIQRSGAFFKIIMKRFEFE